MTTTAEGLRRLSEWIDAGNAHRDPEAQLWGRVAKIGEEHGEVIEAMIGMTGQNPRKGVTHDETDLIQELLDVAVTALGAVEHIAGNTGCAMTLLDVKVGNVCRRAGLAVAS